MNSPLFVLTAALLQILRNEQIRMVGMDEYNIDHVDQLFLGVKWIGYNASDSFLYLKVKNKEWMKPKDFKIYKKLVKFDLDRRKHKANYKYQLLAKFTGWMPRKDLYKEALHILEIDFKEFPTEMIPMLFQRTLSHMLRIY